MTTKAKKITSLLVCLVFMMTLFTGPVYAGKGDKEGTSPTSGTLTGKVADSVSGTAVAGAVVAASGSSGIFTAAADENGAYSVSELSSGRYTVTCQAEGYNKFSGTVNIKNSNTIILDISLTEAAPVTGIITGTVTDSSSGQPISGATVLIDSGQSVTAGTAGDYTLEVSQGTYTVTAEAAGYNSFSKPVNVNPGASETLDFALDPVSASINIVSLTADTSDFVEGTVAAVNLTAVLEGTVEGGAYSWTQVGGPRVDITPVDITRAVVDVSSLAVAVDTELTFRLSVTGSDGNRDLQKISVFVEPADMDPFLGENVQVGGATTAVAKFSHNGTEWAIFNIGSKLCSTPVETAAGVVNYIYVPGFVNDIDIVDYNGVRYALISMGSEGIAVIDLTDPENMVKEFSVGINYYMSGLTFAEGGGAILYDNEISSVNAPVAALATDGTELFIADPEFGIHRTALENLLGSNGPVLDGSGDGTLLIEAEQFTLQYAGENPWGGPVDLKLYGGKLFACMGSLGMGIFDPVTLEQVGRYNLYTDAAVSEDWFVNMDVKQAVHTDNTTGEVYIDEFTGMPDYRQTSFEILEVMKNNADAPTPWADFDRYGKFYYKCQGIDIAEFNGRTIAYLAYSLGGLVAVDITGYQNTAPAVGANADTLFNARYLGYIPAVPANGPKEPTGEQSESLLPYFGAGMLKESGAVDVQVREDYVYLTDHFAGLMIISDAGSPDLRWRGANAPYNNDTNGIMGDHWPDSEFVTSFDMSPYDALDNESMPKWMYEAPCELVTAEINGHGNRLLLMDNMSVDTVGEVDLLECAGAGGFNFIDIVALDAPTMEERYTVPVYFPPTDEIGAFPDGTPGQTISIGHSQGIAASGEYLYVADGPHGISAWKLVDDNGYATDDVHLVANTLQDEYPEIVDGIKIYPASHATNVVFDPVNNLAWSGSASLGLRRVDVSKVENGTGQVGNPLLLPLDLNDCFEHNAEWGTVKGIQYQDHAYDVAIRGNYAFVADGSNGLTVYDFTKDSTDPESGFIAANIGAGSLKPPLGTASGIDLWNDPDSGRTYAVLACGPRGVGVVDITDINNMEIVKVFEPIKYEDDKVGAADGQATDVKVVGDKAYFSYDSFGVVCYSMADLTEALPDGVSPTEVWKKSLTGQLQYDYRPVAVSRFKLQYVPGYEDWAGGAFKMDYTLVNGKLVFYVAFAEAGVLKIDWTDPANPVLREVAGTVGECTAVAISNGRLYAADGGGGLIFFK